MDGRAEAQGLRPKAQEAQEAQEEALRDSELDREIESAVGIEPSPEFLARVRTRIAAEPELVMESGFRWIRPAVESGFSRIRQLSFEPLWAVAIAGIILAVVVPQFVREETAAPKVELARVLDAAVPPAEIVVVSQPMKAPVRQRAVTVDLAELPHTLPLQLSPVLFAEEDQRAFALFVTAVGEGRVPEAVVKRSDESSVDTALSIEPLVIAPLPPLARAAQQGEGQWE